MPGWRCRPSGRDEDRARPNPSARAPSVTQRAGGDDQRAAGRRSGSRRRRTSTYPPSRRVRSMPSTSHADAASGVPVAELVGEDRARRRRAATGADPAARRTATPHRQSRSSAPSPSTFEPMARDGGRLLACAAAARKRAATSSRGGGSRAPWPIRSRQTRAERPRAARAGTRGRRARPRRRSRPASRRRRKRRSGRPRCRRRRPGVGSSAPAWPSA